MGRYVAHTLLPRCSQCPGDLAGVHRIPSPVVLEKEE